MAAMTALVILVTVVITILCYTSAAGRRKVYFLDDLFASYTPMRWILLAIPAALIAGSLCFWQYEGALDSTEGRWGVALQIALLNRPSFVTGQLRTCTRKGSHAPKGRHL
jgi:hypothetical protein